MTDTLFITWQDPKTRAWHPVGRLTFDDNEYSFVYTKGAKASSRFVAFGRMTDFYARYKSKELFPLFANRIPPASRPDYRQYLHWLGFQENGSPNPLAILARTGGERATDSLQVYPMPEKKRDGCYETYFFCHGIRYVNPHVVDAISDLKSGTRLFPMLDILNNFDPNAVAIRTEDPAMMVGYCPRYLTTDVENLASRPANKFELSVERTNVDAPLQLRLLCKLHAIWPRGFQPCSQSEFEPLVSKQSSRATQKARRSAGS